jgi:hypothetical protein
LLIQGGKGELYSAADCHPLPYFSQSPVKFDYQHDLWGVNESHLSFETIVTSIASLGGRQIDQIVQNIKTDRDALTLKRLVVERQPSEFCAIYQQVYPATQVRVKPASLVTIDRNAILKTLDSNGNRTWNEEYWSFDVEGPHHLDLRKLYASLRDAVPTGDRLVEGPFDLKTTCYHRNVWRPQGAYNGCGSNHGFVAAKLTLQQNQLAATFAQWFREETPGSCPP